MNKMKPIRTLALAGIALVMALTLASCMGFSDNSEEDQQTASRQYMSQINQILDDLNAELGSFGEAVAQDDVVTMRKLSENARTSIEAMEKLTPPEDLQSTHEGYIKGCQKLQEALSDYISLYTEVEKATEEKPFDFDSYDDRIKTIQDKYNEGIKTLEETDAEVSEL